MEVQNIHAPQGPFVSSGPVCLLNLRQYMVILFAAFVLQFSVSCACLALGEDQQVGFPQPLSFRVAPGGHRGNRLLLQNRLLEVGWNRSEATRRDVEKGLNCCGFSSFPANGSCAAVSRIAVFLRGQSGPFETGSGSPPAPQACLHTAPSCPTCSSIMQRYAAEVLRFLGGIGLFFSFTEVGGRSHADLSPAWL